VAFEKSTKAKALNVALEQLDEQDFDIAVVLDADNIMAPVSSTRSTRLLNAAIK
jgi:cellulose synthase/poly-beta-1,6-N-acetylglucosamine synthase-like glycosyltransferase